MGRYSGTPFVRRGPTLADALSQGIDEILQEKDARRDEQNKLSAEGATLDPNQPKQRNVLDILLGRGKGTPPVAGTPASYQPLPQDDPATTYEGAPTPAAQQPPVQQQPTSPVDNGMTDTFNRLRDPSFVERSQMPTAIAPVVAQATGQQQSTPAAGAGQQPASIASMIDELYKPTSYTDRAGRKYSVPNADASRMKISEAQRSATIAEKIADDERTRTEKNQDFQTQDDIRTGNDLKLANANNASRMQIAGVNAAAATARQLRQEQAAIGLAQLRGKISAANRAGNTVQSLHLMDMQRNLINSQLGAVKMPTGTDLVMMQSTPEGAAELQSIQDERSGYIAQLAQIESEAEMMRGPGGVQPPAGSSTIDAVNKKTGKTTKQRTDELKAAGVPLNNIPGTLRHEGYMQ